MRKLVVQLIATLLLAGCVHTNEAYNARLQSYLLTYYPSTSISNPAISVPLAAREVVLQPDVLIPGNIRVTNSAFQDLGTIRPNYVIPGQYIYSPPLGGVSWARSLGKK